MPPVGEIVLILSMRYWQRSLFLRRQLVINPKTRKWSM